MDTGKVTVYPFMGVWDYVCIRRMGSDEVDRVIGDSVKVAGIADVCFYVWFVVVLVKGCVWEVKPVAGDHYGVWIYVYSDCVSLEEFAFDKGCTAACHLVKNGVVFVCVAEDEVAGDVG